MHRRHNFKHKHDYDEVHYLSYAELIHTQDMKYYSRPGNHVKNKSCLVVQGGRP